MMEVLKDMPVVLTKDTDWAEDLDVVQAGSILILPEDAVLVLAPTPEANQSNKEGE